MSIILTLIITVPTLILAQFLFKKWFNHLMIFTVTWAGSIILYEMKLIRFVDINETTWWVIAFSFLSYGLGILTFMSLKRYESNNLRVVTKENRLLLDERTSRLVVRIIIFCAIVGFLGALFTFRDILNRYGTIPNIIAHGHEIYRLRVEGVMSGVPYAGALGLAGVVLSAIYSAQKNKITLLSIVIIAVVMLKSLTSLGRAGIFLAFLSFIITFFISRQYIRWNEKFSFKANRSLIFTLFLMVSLSIGSVTAIKNLRGVGESFQQSSPALRQMEDFPIITPSIYLYFSSNIGVLSKYFEYAEEQNMPGENSFRTFYSILSKFELVDRPMVYSKGYFIPMWTNSATAIRDIHADFGILGICLVPFLLGFFATSYWYKFYASGNLKSLIMLSYIYLIIAFYVFYIVSRLGDWTFSLIALLFITHYLQKVNFREKTVQNAS